MIKNTWKNRWIVPAIWGMALSSLAMTQTGCQVSVGGQTLPSPYYIEDDVQYFAPASEFKLAREAAALKAAKGEMNNNQGQ